MRADYSCGCGVRPLVRRRRRYCAIGGSGSVGNGSGRATALARRVARQRDLGPSLSAHRGVKHALLLHHCVELRGVRLRQPHQRAKAECRACLRVHSGIGAVDRMPDLVKKIENAASARRPHPLRSVFPPCGGRSCPFGVFARGNSVETHLIASNPRRPRPSSSVFLSMVISTFACARYKRIHQASKFTRGTHFTYWPPVLVSPPPALRPPADTMPNVRLLGSSG